MVTLTLFQPTPPPTLYYRLNHTFFIIPLPELCMITQGGTCIYIFSPCISRFLHPVSLSGSCDRLKRPQAEQIWLCNYAKLHSTQGGKKTTTESRTAVSFSHAALVKIVEGAGGGFRQQQGRLVLLHPGEAGQKSAPADCSECWETCSWERWNCEFLRFIGTAVTLSRVALWPPPLNLQPSRVKRQTHLQNYRLGFV